MRIDIKKEFETVFNDLDIEGMSEEDIANQKELSLHFFMAGMVSAFDGAHKGTRKIGEDISAFIDLCAIKRIDGGKE